MDLDFAKIRSSFKEGGKKSLDLFEDSKDLSFLEELKNKSKKEMQDFARNSDGWMVIDRAPGMEGLHS